VQGGRKSALSEAALLLAPSTFAGGPVVSVEEVLGALDELVRTVDGKARVIRGLGRAYVVVPLYPAVLSVNQVVMKLARDNLGFGKTLPEGSDDRAVA
jgi:hypothetical protein